MNNELKGIFKRGTTYYFQPRQVNGIRPKEVCLETSELREAITRAAVIRGNPNLTPSGRIAGEIEKHLADGRTFKGKRLLYSRSTSDAKRYQLQLWLDSLPKSVRDLCDVTTAMIQDYYEFAATTQSVATAHKRLMNVRALYQWAIEKNKVRHNPCLGVRTRSEEAAPRVAYCSRQVRDRLIKECPREDLKFVLYCGFHGGFRKNEIVEAVPWWFNVERGHIDMRDTPTMKFTAHKQKRVLPMRDCFRAFLLEYGLRDPFMLWPEVTHGKGLYRYDFAKPFRDYIAASGLRTVQGTEITPHVMRHTFASLLAIEGKSIYKIAAWLGDSVATTEKHYAHLSPSDPDIEETPLIVRPPKKRRQRRDILRPQFARCSGPRRANQKASYDAAARPA
jgi:site-specific recombinase XerD